MHRADQHEFDWKQAEAERPLMEQWERNMKADALNWTNEAFTMVWVLGRNDWEAWKRFPAYQRDIWERAHAAAQAEFDYAMAETPGIVEFRQFKGEVEVFVPRQSWPLKNYPRKRTFAQEFPPISQSQIDEHMKCAQEMADRLSADWSANRPVSQVTFNPFLASTVTMLLGRKIEAVMPEHLEDRRGIPWSWIAVWALGKDPKTINHRKLRP